MTDKKKRFLALGCIVALLVLVAAAIIVTSVRQQQVHLDNGSVWVTSLRDGKAARFNPSIADADAAVAAQSSDFDVAQSGNTTVVDDQTHALPIDAASVAIGKQATMSSTTHTLLGGNTAAFFDARTGKLWLATPDHVSDVSATSAPTATLPSGSKVAVTSDGRVYAYRASDGVVLTYDSPTSSPQSADSLTGNSPTPAQDFTMVGSTPVALTGSTVRWPGKTVHLSGEDLHLQSTPTDGTQTGYVAVASSNGLNTVDLKSGSVTTYATPQDGLAAIPASEGGCVYAAWSTQKNNYLKVCAAGKTGAHFETLSSITPTSQLVFRVNHRAVILNDATNGNVWNPNDSTDVIKIEWNKLTTQKSTSKNTSQKSVQNHQDFTEKCTSKDEQIKAVDDEFGARAGGEQILDVLRNDQQTSCSVLHIEKVEPIDASAGSVAQIYDGRYLQLSLSDKASGQVSFSYSITDGRGNSSSATVTLTVENNQINSAPAQTDTPPDTSVEQGASVKLNALDSFSDPDGDAMTLVSASAQNSEKVSITTRADGQLVFNPGSMSEGRVGVNVTVSDGSKSGHGIVYFSVKAANTLKPVIDPIVRKVEPGASADVPLKDYVHSNSAAPLQLESVKPPEGTQASTNTDDMSVKFSSSATGTHYVTYTVRQGEQEALGMIRFDVAPLSEAEKRPIAANDTALLTSANTAIVDPLDNDVDPLGGVLAVTSVKAEANSGVKTGLVNHNRLYITAQKVPTKPVKISYGIANAAGTATGRITLQPPNLQTSTSAPVAKNINATVRQGGIVTIKVMDHVSASDGTTVSLSTKLQYDEKSFKGLVFVSGDTLRYQASSTIGSFPVIYTVKDNLGNSASATATIVVHKKDSASKPKPKPADVQAQAVAGQKVKIPINLLGIDPDGDDVQLLGLGNQAPKKGRIDEVGADYLLYEAYPNSSGTDTFQYAVEDWTGQRTVAQARVGILKNSTDSGVYARDDSIQMRPNRAVDVPVAVNDISEDNEDLHVDPHLESQGITGATVKDNNVEFTTPSQSGDYYIVYTVKNKAGLADTATLSVSVSPNAPISAPSALDDLVPPSKTIDQKSVDVDVSDFISNPSGTVSDLAVNVDPSARDHAHKSKGTVLSIELTDQARAVPYTVTNTRYNLTSTAFIQVPAYGVFPPLLRPKAPPLTVNSGELLTIKLGDYVRVGAGKQPHVQSASDVSATQSDGSSLYKDSQTLTFRSPKNYSGPASITFTVQDAAKSGPGVSTSVLTLPITVIGKNTAPPTFASTTLNVVAGEAPQNISLAALTTAPSGLETAKSTYEYSLASNPAKGFTAELGKKGDLRVSADSDITPGATSTVGISIRYDGTKTVKGAITLKASATNRPLARVADIDLKASAGKTSDVNVLGGAYNPFPSKPLRLVDATSTTSKLSVKWKASGQVSITPAKDVGAMNATVLFTLVDATGSQARQVSAKVNVSVTDRPAPPLLSPMAGTPQNGRVSLAWTPGSANGSPITEYEVDWDGGSKPCGQVTQCIISDLKNGATYTFKVRARNAEGWSNYSNSVTAVPDTVPGTPSASAKMSNATGQATVEWTAPSDQGSPITAYKIEGCGVRETVDASKTSVTLTGISAPMCDFDVSAKNNLGWGPAGRTNRVPVPGAPGKPTISLPGSIKQGRASGTVSVNTNRHTLTDWDCTVDGSPCASKPASNSASGSFSIALPEEKWYAGGTVTVRIIAHFDLGEATDSEARVNVEALSLNPTLEYVNRNQPSNTVKYRFHINGGDPAKTNLLATKLVIGGCTLRERAFNSSNELTDQIPSNCTDRTATLQILRNGVTLGSTQLTVTDTGASNSGTEPTAFRQALEGFAPRSTTRADFFVPLTINEEDRI